TAFLFACLALQCLQEASRLSNHYSLPYSFLSGCCVCCACLSKQYAGAFFLPICFGVLLIQGFQLTRRLIVSLALFSAGTLSVALAFWGWLRLFSDPAIFWRHAVEIAGEVGKARFSHPQAVFEGTFLCLL